MTPFVQLTAIAAPLPLANVDTDKILPARFLKTITRRGLGSALFAVHREDPAFILNRSPWDKAQILLARDNFGCGSSREHAPWALLDFGIRCVIAPSFADIFINNCYKNGILPIVLTHDDVESLLSHVANPATACLSVDLPTQTVVAWKGKTYRFDVNEKHKQDMLLGLDEIARSLELEVAVQKYEAANRQPWLAGAGSLLFEHTRNL